MTSMLTKAQAEAQEQFRAFADRHIVPHAEEYHRTQRTPPHMVELLAAEGLLGLPVPEEYGGGGCDAVTLGLLAGELGHACSSLRSLLTVHTMVAHAVARWGSHDLKETWLPRLARGESVGALAVSEPGAGSDAAGVTSRLDRDGDHWLLNGHKTWTTYGEIADVFLVLGRSAHGPTAVLVERGTDGLRTELIEDLIGIRASMTANVYFEGCRVPDGHVLARPGLGLSHVVGTALDLGRYTVGWGCVGIIDACLEASTDYASSRETFGTPIKEHQLVRRLISTMYTDAQAARLLCLEAGRLRDAGDPGALAQTSVAKYFASTAATRAAADAVQIHGANGCGSGYPVQRYLGDSRVMEIIEGSSQIHQVGLAEYAFQERALDRRRRQTGSTPTNEGR
ncbi:acyl-CoA dehydrogenase family protein [Streptomyces sp. NPDC006355]|uniref:acyl-CoA dehydrogenase family protein n=1 Tax=Streptomyces sp. NPDC006355 TaxID=3156758 RepID=UPI0033BE420D